jgi:hypothetical protein
MKQFRNTILAMGLTVMAISASATTVPAGTEVWLKFDQSLDSGTAKVGERVKLHVAHDVMVNGRDVAPAGTQVWGVVTTVDKRGRFGKNGRLRITIDPIDTGHGHLPVQPRDKGKDFKGSRTDQAALLSGGGALLLGPVGLVGGYFVAGKQVRIKPGDNLRTEVSDTVHIH